MTTRLASLLVVVALSVGGCTQRPVAITGVLRGRLTTTSTQPLHGTVRLSGAIEAAVSSGDDGVFTFDRVPVGPYVVSAAVDDTLEGVVTRSVLVTGGEDDPAVELRLTGVGRVRGTITLEGEPIATGTQIVIAGRTAVGITTLDGSFALDRVPEGNAAFFAVHSGWEPIALETVEVRRGQETTLAAREMKKSIILTTSFTGKATVPGVTDHTGIAVKVAGTDAVTSTNSDGTFTLNDVPLGIVTLELRRDVYTASISPVWITSNAAPIVLATKPFTLPTIDLVFGERTAIGSTTNGAVTTDGTTRIESVYGAYLAEDSLVATNLASGARTTLEHANLFRMHPDGQRVIAYQYRDLPGDDTALVVWDPKTNTTTVLENNVDRLVEWLAPRNEILVHTPTLRVVPIDGSPVRTMLSGRDTSHSSLSITIDAKAQTAVVDFGNYDYYNAWIDLTTGVTINEGASTLDRALWLAPSGKAVFIATAQKSTYLLRSTGVEKVFATGYVFPTPSPDGRYFSYPSNGIHLFDLETEKEIAKYDAPATESYAPDGTRVVVVRGSVVGGKELDVIELPSGNRHAAVMLIDEVGSNAVRFYGRGAYYLQQNPDRLERLDLDTNQVTIALAGISQYSVFTADGKLLAIDYDVGEQATTIYDVATPNAAPKTFPGTPLFYSDDLSRLATVEGQRLVYHNVTSGRDVALMEGWYVGYNGLSPPTVSLAADGALTIRRVSPSYDVEIFPTLALNNGLWIGMPDQVGQP